MAQEKRLVFLTPGQQPPSGNTGIVLPNGGLMWIGKEGTFPTDASFGKILDSDDSPNSTYNNRLATNEEINEYIDIQTFQPGDGV